MRNLVYDVSISLDGYISGLDSNINGFVPDGYGVDQYFRDLKNFDTVIMGKTPLNLKISSYENGL